MKICDMCGKRIENYTKSQNKVTIKLEDYNLCEECVDAIIDKMITRQSNYETQLDNQLSELNKELKKEYK